MGDAAFVKMKTNRTIQSVRQQSFPQKFVCNRDEWLRGEADELDCDSLLGFLGAIDISGYLMGTLVNFQMWVLIIIPIVTIVYEKEHRMLIIMRQMGLSTRVFWHVTYLFELTKFMFAMTFMMIIGNICGITYFTKQNQLLLWFMIFVWGNVYVMPAFVLSSLFRSANTAMSVGLIIVLLFLLMQGAVGWIFVSAGPSGENFGLLMIFPPAVMFRWAESLSFSMAFKEYLAWDNFGTLAAGTFSQCLLLMIVHWIVLVLILVWLNFVVDDTGGGSEKPYFCFQKTFWAKLFARNQKKTSEVTLTVHNYAADDCVPEILGRSWHRPHDAQEEHDWCIGKRSPESNPHVRVVSLHKVFPGKGKNVKDKVAVRSVSFGVKRGECFGLLGHNGAGKSTAINMLTGLFPVSEGNAYIGGNSVRDDGMQNIYCDMGICPQHDLLWPNLTAREHLEFYGRLKGLEGQSLKQAVVNALASVNLLQFSNRKARAFSGGMKRRLSMANALMGDPTVVIMDEPSTGLDPDSKHKLWDVISRAKLVGKRSMLLTTHSMEEADVLCNRLAIMADGEIQCIGFSHVLKMRFGAGYTLMMKTSSKASEDDVAVQKFVKEMFPSATLLSEPIGGTSKFELDRNEVVLSQFFEKVSEAKSSLKLDAWSLSETTLEQVFLRLASLTEMFAGGANVNESQVVPVVVKDDQETMADRVAKIDRSAKK